jgi:hypothetical protein
VAFSGISRWHTCLWVHTKALCNLRDSLGPEGSLCVCGRRQKETIIIRYERTDICDLALGTTQILRQLRNDRHGMAQLRLPASKLAKHLTDAHRLKATAQDSIKLLTPRTNLQHPLPLLSQLLRRLEPASARLTLPHRILDFIHLDLAEALDLEQVAPRGRVHRGDGVVAVCLELGDVDGADAVGLNRVDVDDEAVLIWEGG